MNQATPTVEKLADHIVARLSTASDFLRDSFEKSAAEIGVRYCVLDELLPVEIAHQIYGVFPKASQMRLMDSFREKKYTSKNLDQFDPLMTAITFAVQDPRVVRLVEGITGIENQIPDSKLYAGGLSAMGAGHFLGPHIDNSHDAERKLYRTLNLLYYVTPDWTLENGGNLELWDSHVQRKVTTLSAFNRLIIMETNPWSWHSVNEVMVNKLRCCVSNYYFSEQSPTGVGYFNVTSFSARPEQKILRFIASIDNKVRQFVRYFKPSGLGIKDTYK
jgi:Rps23 Pro-64 3,4-dihydroxylase Tpa1-like proline 4-hydroxylase